MTNAEMDLIFYQISKEIAESTRRVLHLHKLEFAPKAEAILADQIKNRFQIIVARQLINDEFFLNTGFDLDKYVKEKMNQQFASFLKNEGRDLVTYTQEKKVEYNSTIFEGHIILVRPS